MKMKALITVINREEALKAIEGGCDILDIKNPSEGSLGANFPWVIKEIMECVPKGIKTSIAIGDAPNLPGTISLAVSGAAIFEPHYIKIGLKGPKSKEDALNIALKAVKALKSLNSPSKIVLVGYADYKRTGTIAPMQIPEIAEEAGAAVGMMDTLVKDGSNLLDSLGVEELLEFVGGCHERGLEAALAGSLGEHHIKTIAGTGADIFGVRGAVCRKGDREGLLDAELVRKITLNVRAYS